MIDRAPRTRQAKKLARKQGKRKSADRILIVSEGSKTEPHYFAEIRSELKLRTADIRILPCAYGTSPRQVVEYAKDLFVDGNPHTGINAKAFERVYAVFDRDTHDSYNQALSLVDQLNKRNLKNDNRIAVEFIAAPSVLCFELWLLLHYEDCINPIQVDDVINHLKIHIPDYEKGDGGYYAKTKDKIDAARGRANSLSKSTTQWNGVEPYTAIAGLVDKLRSQAR